MLRLPGQTLIPWAVFDADWYFQAYPEVGKGDPQAMLEYYLRLGQARGHSPNRWFDEAWHRRRYPRLAERIAAGAYPSAFDAYCRRGALDRSGHWLFDELAYRDRYSDLTDEVLGADGIVNGYDHYLRHGGEQDRIGHLLFDPALYLSHFDATEAPAIRAGGVFRHYLDRIESGLPERATSRYFDPVWYLRRYPEVARGITEGRWKCALHHYLCNDTPTEFDPLESFSEAWYLQRDPGLREVVESRSFSHGYMHFLQFGAAELRSPSEGIDLARHAALPSVIADLASGRAANAYAHWLLIGAPAKLASAGPPSEQPTEAQAVALSRQVGAALLPIAGRFGYCFDCGNEPAASVVIVVSDRFPTTMATIAALRASSPRIELIVVDCGSTDETRFIGRYIPGAKVLRFEQAIDWSKAADAGRQLANAPAILFLSGAARLAHGSLERATARLAADPSVGAVGGMTLQPHGVVAQAGGILWNDGSIHDYQRGASPLAPEVNFVRDADFCSADLLLIGTELLARLDGLDHGCAAGYHAVDLCLRAARAGFRVVYDPSVMAVLDEPAPPGDGCGEYFRRKHAAVLAERLAPGGAAEVIARHSGKQPHRVLFIEDTIPVRRTGSGFVRANDLIWVMSSLGYSVTVFPVNGCDHDLAPMFGDLPETVEAMHTISLDGLAAFLKARPGYYDTIWIARTHNLALIRPILAALNPTARIVLDTEALTPEREALQAALAGTQYDVDSAMQAMRADASLCQRTVAVTNAEAETLRRHGFPSVAVIGHMIEPRPTERRFAQRSGMLFVGAIHTADSPNLDSLIWFVDAVLPLIEAELTWETRLTIAGHVAPGVDLGRFGHHPRITLRGPVADPQPLYDAHRVFVAPTRYAAGTPYKVLEAASQGVPVVATELLRGELGWRAGQEILSADADDAAAFAAHAVALYRDETLWGAMRDAALRRVSNDHGAAGYAKAVAAVLRRPG